MWTRARLEWAPFLPGAWAQSDPFRIRGKTAARSTLEDAELPKREGAKVLGTGSKSRLIGRPSSRGARLPVGERPRGISSRAYGESLVNGNRI